MFAAFAIVAGAVGGAYTTVSGDAAVGAASQDAPAARMPTANSNGPLLGVVPSRPPDAAPSEYSTSSTAREPRVAANTLVTYHGGPVLHASSIYTVFWMPPGHAMPAGYSTVINQYFSDVAHDSYLPSNVYGSTVQYYETTPKRFASYNVANKGPGIDARPFPKGACPNYTLADNTKSRLCLTRAQLQKEIASYVASHSIPTGAGNDGEPRRNAYDATARPMPNVDRIWSMYSTEGSPPRRSRERRSSSTSITEFTMSRANRPMITSSTIRDGVPADSSASSPRKIACRQRWVISSATLPSCANSRKR